MPLRGAKTQPGFHPFANPILAVDLSPVLAEESAVGPCGERKPSRVFIPLRTYPRFWPRNQRQAGRIPSCGGCASPAGAQCRRMTVFCLPSR
ncbi:MAG: hypothetical protein LBK61_06240, partial [Spirochaetaceae bacterium]|nr:hypothetical protein [Spirochaetaceae bacterium]